MKAFFYTLGLVLLAASSTGMAFLPRLAPTPLLFAIVGAVLSALVPGSWLLLSATADRWPRPRAGHVLMAAGVLGILFSLRDMQWLSVGWACYVICVGVGVTLVPLASRTRNQDEDRNPGPVRGPLGRRVDS